MMRQIYLQVTGPAHSDAEVESTPGLEVAFAASPDITKVNSLELSYFQMACDKLTHGNVWHPAYLDIPQSWRGILDGISNLGPAAIKEDPKYPDHPLPPVPVASALTAIVLAQLPSSESESNLHLLATDSKSRELDFGALIGHRLLATLKLIKKLNPVMFQSITTSLELANDERYPEAHELIKMQSDYKELVTDIIAFIIMQQYGLMSSEDTAIFKKSILLNVLTPELEQFDGRKRPIGDFAEMCSNFYDVLDSDGLIEMYFGSESALGEDKPNSNLKHLLQYIKTGVLLKVLKFDTRMRDKSAKYLELRKQLLNPRISKILRP